MSSSTAVRASVFGVELLVEGEIRMLFVFAGVQSEKVGDLRRFVEFERLLCEVEYLVGCWRNV